MTKITFTENDFARIFKFIQQHLLLIRDDYVNNKAYVKDEKSLIRIEAEYVMDCATLVKLQEYFKELENART